MATLPRMVALRERISWSKPKVSRGPDLTPDEAARVKAVLAALRIRYGSLKALARAMGLKVATVQYASQKRTGVSAGVALRTARAAGQPVEAILSGAWPTPNTCPHCGRG